MSTFRLHIVTPTKDFYSGEVEYVSVDTPDGKEGFLKDALPRVAILSRGCIEVKTSVLEMRIICGDGLVSVTESGVTVLSEFCRFEDEDSGDESETGDVLSEEEYKRVKAKLGSSIKNMRKRRGTDVK